MKKVERLKDKSMLEALKSVDNPWEMISFLFAYRSKEILLFAVFILILFNMYPQIVDFVIGLFK